MNTTGERLLRAIQHQRLTMAAFAPACGVSLSAVHKWVYNVNALRGVRLVQVARHLKVHPAWLEHGVDDVTREWLDGVAQAWMDNTVSTGELTYLRSKLTAEIERRTAGGE